MNPQTVPVFSCASKLDWVSSAAASRVINLAPDCRVRVVAKLSEGNGVVVARVERERPVDGPLASPPNPNSLDVNRASAAFPFRVREAPSAHSTGSPNPRLDWMWQDLKKLNCTWPRCGRPGVTGYSGRPERMPGAIVAERDRGPVAEHSQGEGKATNVRPHEVFVRGLLDQGCQARAPRGSGELPGTATRLSWRPACSRI